MQIFGIALAVSAAILWGLADSIATVSARRQAIFMTTLLSQISGLLVLAALATFGRGASSIVTVVIPLRGLFMSALTGICAAVGYFSLYQAMEKGPLAITSPLSSTSALVTLGISMVVLGERVTFVEGVAIAAVILGVMLASTRLSDLLKLFKQESVTLLTNSGVRWAYGAIVAFGCMDFSIGAMSPMYGWFAPVFWTRIFSVTLFLSVFMWQWCRKKMASRERASAMQMPFFRRPYRLYRERREEGVSVLHICASGARFAIVAGVLESAAVLTFSMATRIIQPGETAAIASNYSVVAVLFGIIVFRERIAASQFLAIVLVVCGITTLALTHP